MTEQTNAELIAQFRSEGNEWSGKYGRMFFEAADAVEAAEQRAAELAAVVEKVREADAVTSSWDHFGHLVMDILTTAPADALRELKADVWEEGSETGFTHGMSYQAGNNSAMNYRNPYRKEQS